MKKRGGCIRFEGASVHTLSVCLFFAFLLMVFTSSVFAELGPENVLVLVNKQSATSQYIAKMYRQYYPAIQDNQVLELDGLADCSGPSSTAADEIITREVYNSCIAAPVRQYLLDNDLIAQIMVIITTAGMPYRIEDIVYGDVIYPAGSNYSCVSLNCSAITAASVESELTCLWYADEFGLENRMVNPYQGYRASSITLFARTAPGTKSFLWNNAISITGTPPKMEGQMKYWPVSYGTINRSFNAGDIYLTCRLDGPKVQGTSAVFSVRKMLERAKCASAGLDPANAVIVIDDASGKYLDDNRVFNLDSSVNYYTYSPDTPQPPDAPTVLSMNDYGKAFEFISNQATYEDDIINTGYMDLAYGLKVILDKRAAQRTSQSDLGTDERVVFYCGYGRNGDEGTSSTYLTTGLDGGALFKPANGAVFTSIESFNALTMFSDLQTVPVAQGKIVDFITIGGTGAIGHAFEPISSAIIDNAYFSYNLFADGDGDSVADLTFVEAAFTGIPFLSWSEVVIGDPLMRMKYQEQEDIEAWEACDGDVNGDRRVNIIDIALVRQSNGGMLYSDDPVIHGKYNDLCDFNADGRTNIIDIALAKSLNGTVY